MLAWPKSFCTYLGCLSAIRSIVAQVWRKSCSLIAGSPALFKRGLQCRPNKVVQLIVAPVVVGNTRPLSCQREPALSLSPCSDARGGF